MRVLLLTDSPNITTGYGNIARNFALALRAAGHEPAFAATSHSGSRLEYVVPNGGPAFPHYNCIPVGRLADAVRDFSPAIVLHIRDALAFIQKWWPPAYSVRGNAAGIPVWGWVPVQHETVPWEYVEAYHNEYARVLTYTPSGVDVLGNAGVVKNRLDWLMPGVSPSYGPDGPEARLGRPGVPLVMSAGVPDQDRKMFPYLMRAYREIRDEVDVDFYLHTSMVGAFDLPTHARTLSVMGHWLFPLAHDKALGMPEETLAGYYRRATAYATVSTGEGLNMPLMEAAASGCAVVYTDLPPHVDVTEGYPDGLRFPVSTHPFPRNVSWERVPDVGDLARQLRLAVSAKRDPAAGRAYREAHSWAATADRFLSIARDAGVA